MKKRMWLWCLIAAFGLSFSVACSDDDEKEVTPTPPPVEEPTPTPPPVEEPTPTQSVIVVDTMEVAANIEEVPYTGGTITFTTTTNQDYTVASTADWITIDSDGRALTATYTVTATVAANEGEAREGKITVTFADEAKTVKEVVVKQAAYVAPEQTPQTPVVPDPEVETVTVNVEVYAGVATQTVSAADVATKLGVEDLAAAIADGSVTYVGLNADGTVYTAEDGSTPASTTQGSCGHWYSTEFNPMVWGTEGLTLFAYLEGDGASYTLGYADANAFVEGETYKLAGKYIYGDAEVVFEVVMTGVAAPEVPDFVAPEADYTYTSELEYNNSWYTTSWTMTAEDEVAILAALGLDGDYDYEGAIADAVTAGDIIIKGFNADGTLTENVTSDHTGNSGYWFAADGTVSTYGSGTMCAEFGSGSYYEGTMCMMANLVEEEKTYPGYYVYTAGDAQVIVKLEMYVAPKPAEPVFEVVETYEFTRDVVYVAEYGAVAETFSIETQMTDIEGLIGGTPDTFQMSAYNDNLEPIFQSWSVTDGWFGVDGAANWGNDARFCMKPTATGTFNSDCCMPDVSAGTTGKCTFRYGNSATMKAVDVVITVNIAAE